MILVDTNILVAVANSNDTNHVGAVQLVASVTDPLVILPTVLAEVCYLVHERGGARAEVAVLRSVAQGELLLAELTVGDVARMAELAETYADLGLGATDASIVAVAERLRVTSVATFDRRHFTVVRPNHTTRSPSCRADRTGSGGDHRRVRGSTTAVTTGGAGALRPRGPPRGQVVHPPRRVAGVPTGPRSIISVNLSVRPSSCARLQSQPPGCEGSVRV